MSVTVTKSEGVTVFTLTSDPQSPWPPLCQIFKGLCYSPVCCSVSHHLRGAQGGSLSVLGTLQIMAGLLNIGLGAVICSHGGMYLWEIEKTLPLWMGGIFIVSGIVCILSEKFPSRCLVVVTVILNLTGAAFAIAALVLYIINIVIMRLWWMCGAEMSRFHKYQRPGHPTISPEDLLAMTQKCEEGKTIIMFLLRSINGVLIVVSVLQICVSISSAVLGIKALKSRRHGDDKSSKKPGKYYRLLDEGSSDPTA